MAASIGYNLLPSSVAITKVVTSASSPTAVDVTYTIVGSSPQFVTSAAAYTAYSNALTTSIANGAYANTLAAKATVNGAVYLAGSSVVPQQVSVQTVMDQILSKPPTTAPSYSPGGPTPVPSARPSPSPSLSPTSPPTYFMGILTPGPTLSPTSSPASMFAAHVRLKFISTR